MAGPGSILGLLKALGRASWRDLRSFRSISGNNLFLFIGFVALQPESAEFFGVMLIAVMLFPLSTDPMQLVPRDRRMAWALTTWEWSIARVGSFALSPLPWLAILLLFKTGWRMGSVALGVSVLLPFVRSAAKRWGDNRSGAWLHWIPRPPGLIGSLMRLQWRAMLRTLDPYVAFVLMACAEAYRAFGKPLDPTAPRIMALLVTLALSTQTQVLFGLDGHGAERYRYVPIRGWQVLLAKDLAFLALLGLLVLPLDFMSGIVSGFAVLAIGHHQSVLKPNSQAKWRFTSGALFPDGVIQIMALFAVGLAVRSEGTPLIIFSLLAWFASLLFYGQRWDRQAPGQAAALA